MKRILPIIVWSAFTAACAVTSTSTPPVVTQPVQPPPIAIDDPTFPQQCRDIWQQELRREIDPAGLAGCLEQFRRGDSGDQVRATVQASDEWKEAHKPAPPAPRIVTLAEDPIFKANFGSEPDPVLNIPIFTPFMGALYQDGRLDVLQRWLRILAAQGCTYLVVQTESKPYPGYPIRGFDFRGDRAQFVAFLRWLQTQPAADGGAWRFLIHHTSGDNDRQEAAPGEIAEWAPFLRPFVPVARMSPGFEIFGDWKTINVSRAFVALHEAYGAGAALQGWGQPGRATAASYHGDGTEEACRAQGYGFNPYHDAKRPGLGGCTEPDDPVNGDEVAGMARLEGLQWMTHYAFQFEHGRAVLEPCGRTEPVEIDEVQGFRYPSGCAMGRFDDVVARLGRGVCTDDLGRFGGPCGWPIKHLDVMETDTYDFFRGNSSPAIAERIANDALKVCETYGITCGFGSGLPTAWRPKR
jgi:hypothetical protein